MVALWTDRWHSRSMDFRYVGVQLFTNYFIFVRWLNNSLATNVGFRTLANPFSSYWSLYLFGCVVFACIPLAISWEINWRRRRWQTRQPGWLEGLYSSKKTNFKASSLGIACVDRLNGPFRLEVDWIGVHYDKTHFEQYAYEEYKMPIQPLYTVLWSIFDIVLLRNVQTMLWR